MKKTLMGMMLVLALAGSTVAEELPSKDQVLNRFITAVGGEKALQARTDLCYEGNLVLDMTGTDPRFLETPFKACAEKNGRLLYVESADWADLPQADSGEPHPHLRWIMNPEFALVVEEFFPDLEVLHRKIRSDRSVIVLVPKSMEFEHNALYFDEETGLLNHIGNHNDLKDWKVTDGVLFPHSVVFKYQDGHTIFQFSEMKNKF